MRRGLWVVALLVATALSGCSDSETKGVPQTSAPPATVTDTTGGIQGAVVNENVEPLKNAQVGVAGLNSSETFTDSGGRYSFSKVEPGKYTVNFEKIGFIKQTKDVTVEAGRVSFLNASLVATVAAPTPYNKTFIFPGEITAGGAGFSTCEPCGHDLHANKSARSIVLELLFTPTVGRPTGDNKMYLALYTPEAYDDPLGFSTVGEEVEDRGKVVAQGNWTDEKDWVVTASCSIDWACAQQKFEIFATVFYHRAAPTSFTALK